MHPQVVIGANYGDEGKGLVTDWLTQEAVNRGGKPVVVRFNGGAQAGHTVVTPHGERHVFGHFGSGALAGADTVLSRHFIVNPIMLARERRVLQPMRANLFCAIDQSARITTPYDMLMNRMAEMNRGADRHGSCGLGINETVVRNEGPEEFRLTAGEAARMTVTQLVLKLKAIRGAWTAYRMTELDIEHFTPEMAAEFEAAMEPDVLDRFVDDVREMAQTCPIYDTPDFLWGYHKRWEDAGQVIFEGAQGLLLHEERWSPENPHVTRSRTGIENAAEIAAEVGFPEIRAYYVTRTYVTRHGAGPLEHEERWRRIQHLTRLSLRDETNVTNEWQQRLRYAPLDPKALAERIWSDCAAAKMMASFDVVVTHTDQTLGGELFRDQIEWMGPDGDLERGAPRELVTRIGAETDAVDTYIADGPTRASVREAKGEWWNSRLVS